MRIEDEIKQKQFDHEYIKLNINLLFTTSWITSHLKKSLDPYKISWQQFNILRILKGTKGEPIALKTISSRMIDKTSNTSRLIDKLLLKKMIDRVTCPEDRRKVNIGITKYGLETVDRASNDLEASIVKLFENLDEKEAKQVNQLLDKLRN